MIGWKSIRIGLSMGVDSSSGVTGPPGVLIWGQSNAEGRDSATNLTGGNTTLTAAGPSGCPMIAQWTIAQDPTTWQYGGANGDAGGNGSLVPPPTFGTVSPHKSLGGGNLNAVGPELTMARDFVAGSTGIAAIAKFTVAGGALGLHLAPGINFPTQPTGGPDYWQQTLTFIALANLSYRAIYFYQGESDCASTPLATGWFALAQIVLSGLRSACGNVPIVMALIPSGSSGLPGSGLATVRASQQLICDQTPWCTLINNDDASFIADNVHVSADSQATAGHRAVTAITAALITTTLTGSISSSPNPVVTSSALTYTINVTNSGANSASNVCATATLDAGVVFGSGAGTGWTVVQTGQSISCKRATLAVGAAPAITLTCTAPSSFGTGSAVTSMSVVGSNISSALTGTSTTTLQLPAATKDTLQDVFIPATGAEYTALALVTPFAIHRCQEASGNLADSTGGGFGMTATATITYNAAVSGWTSTGVSCADLGGSFLLSTGPNPASESFMWLLYYSISGAPAAQRDFVACYTSTYTVRVTTTPRFGCHLGASAPVGTFTPVGSGPIVLQYNKTAGSAALYTLNEKIVPAFTSQTSIAFKMLGGNAGTIMYGAMFRGANAELTSGQVKTFLTTLGNGHWSSIPWS